MKIIVDYDSCESNGVCETIAPEIFHVDDDDNLQIIGDLRPEVIEKVHDAVRSCPRNALSLQED